ncbi:MAG TPA: LuxR C-terminal-related transcriptional regulator, partial [Methyloversatilis sp.]
VYRQATTCTPPPVEPEEAASNGTGVLSPREHDILRGIARGDSNKLIARDLGIAETTVKIHVQHILRKLGVSSRVQVAVIAVERGLV